MSKHLSRYDLECIAHRITKRYYRMLGVGAGELTPIDPILLSEEIIKLRVSFAPLSVDGSILGLAAFDDVDLDIVTSDGNTTTHHLHNRDIVIDTGLQQSDCLGRCNFTVAHEAGHHILNLMFPNDYGPICNRKTHIMYRRSKEAHDWIEWQSDNLASPLLMPVPLVLQSLAYFGFRENIVEMLNKVFRPKEYERFCDMADYMCVSKQALSIRLQQLGILSRDKNYLANPYELLRIYCDEPDLC